MKLLFAEDEAEVRSVLREFVRAEGTHELLEAADGEEAWKLLEAGGVDAAILDVTMPKLDGLGLLQRMRADDRFKSLPTILCTALMSRDIVLQAGKFSVSRYLVKPFRASAVFEEIQKIEAGLARTPILEEPAAASSRLGLETSAYLRLALQLAHEVEQRLAAFRQAPQAESATVLHSRLGVLRTTCGRLGAPLLGKSLQRVRACLLESRRSIDLLAAESRESAQTLRALPAEVAQALEEALSEAERLRRHLSGRSLAA